MRRGFEARLCMNSATCASVCRTAGPESRFRRTISELDRGPELVARASASRRAPGHFQPGEPPGPRHRPLSDAYSSVPRAGFGAANHTHESKLSENRSSPLRRPARVAKSARVFRRSSAVEQLTVNQLVVGSIPTAGAKFSQRTQRVTRKFSNAKIYSLTWNSRQKWQFSPFCHIET